MAKEVEHLTQAEIEELIDQNLKPEWARDKPKVYVRFLRWYVFAFHVSGVSS